VRSSLRVKIHEIRPKVDHNISLAGLLLTDADTASLKVERAREGPIKGLLNFKKELPTGEVYILNGAEFPNSEAVDMLLYLIWHAEQNNWNRLVQFKGLNTLAKEVFGVKRLGKAERRLIERILTVWKFHGYYFKDSFVWQGKRITTQFGVIDDWQINSFGRGRPAELKIWFNEKFIEICKHTDWYRRPTWIEIKKLRKEIAKSLYLLALEYKPGKDAKTWRIYIDKDIKFWYRNALNSLAELKHLYPKLIVEKRLKPAIDEINVKTNLFMELVNYEKDRYYIKVAETINSVPVNLPFYKYDLLHRIVILSYLAQKNSTLTSAALLRMAEKLSSEEIRDILDSVNIGNINLADLDDLDGFELSMSRLNTLFSWMKEMYSDKPVTYNLICHNKIMLAIESEEEIIFICQDVPSCNMLSKLSQELSRFFGKRVKFVPNPVFLT